MLSGRDAYELTILRSVFYNQRATDSRLLRFCVRLITRTSYDIYYPLTDTPVWPAMLGTNLPYCAKYSSFIKAVPGVDIDH